MRSRIIRPGFFSNEKLARLGWAAGRLFQGLWCLADRAGLLKDIVATIHGNIFPHNPEVNVDKLLSDLHRGGFVKRYRVGQRRYIQIINFTQHQPIHPKEARSIIPPPRPRKSRGPTLVFPGNSPAIPRLDRPSSTSIPPSTPTPSSQRDRQAGVKQNGWEDDK